MAQVALKEAETQLARLVQAARQGEEIILTEDDKPVARLVSIDKAESKSTPRAQFGSGKGIIVYMAPDFDAPLEDFQDYAGQ